VRGTAIVGVLTLAVAACGSKPAEDTAGGSANKDFKACMVSDSGGFDDKSFNQTSYKGLQDAVKAKGLTEVKAESKSDNDYPTNMTAMVNAKCNVIVAVGFKLEDATDKAAQANPSIKFSIVDSAPAKPITNVKPLLFNTAQAAFQAGYLAAGMTKSGKVGTFGGVKIPPVTIYMDGIADGIAYFNKEKGKKVKLLGWNPSTQKGTFTGNFTDQNKAKTFTTNFLNADADVIIPVAGSLYQGAGAAIKSSGKKAVLEGVDADLVQTDTAGYKSLFLVSILKNIQVTTNDVVSAAAKGGSFDNSQYVGNLKNDGVGLSSFHDYESKLPAGLTDEIEKIKNGISDGSIEAASKAAFK
jgi:basic membrane protein A